MRGTSRGLQSHTILFCKKTQFKCRFLTTSRRIAILKKNTKKFFCKEKNSNFLNNAVFLTELSSQLNSNHSTTYLNNSALKSTQPYFEPLTFFNIDKTWHQRSLLKYFKRGLQSIITCFVNFSLIINYLLNLEHIDKPGVFKHRYLLY